MPSLLDLLCQFAHLAPDIFEVVQAGRAGMLPAPRPLEECRDDLLFDFQELTLEGAQLVGLGHDAFFSAFLVAFAGASAFAGFFFGSEAKLACSMSNMLPAGFSSLAAAASIGLPWILASRI